ncbi:Uncharacterised protein [Mycobacterium tuberculosis]|nr:Uncharacterised protein [Mycobacterium tuberculosis]
MRHDRSRIDDRGDGRQIQENIVVCLGSLSQQASHVT